MLKLPHFYIYGGFLQSLGHVWLNQDRFLINKIYVHSLFDKIYFNTIKIHFHSTIKSRGNVRPGRIAETVVKDEDVAQTNFSWEDYLKIFSSTGYLRVQ